MSCSSHLVVNSCDVLKASVIEPLNLLVIDKEGISEDLSSFFKQLLIYLEVWLFVDGAIIATKLDISFSGLNPASRDTAAVSLRKQGRPVFDSTEDVTDMNEIELIISPCPTKGCVVYFEANVWWNPFWLTWGEVGTDNLDIRMTVSEFTRFISERLRSGPRLRLHGPDT